MVLTVAFTATFFFPTPSFLWFHPHSQIFLR